MKHARTFRYESRTLDVSSLVGIVAGLGMLFSASLWTGMELLALPGFVLLVPGLLWSAR